MTLKVDWDTGHFWERGMEVEIVENLIYIGETIHVEMFLEQDHSLRLSNRL